MPCLDTALGCTIWSASVERFSVSRMRDFFYMLNDNSFLIHTKTGHVEIFVNLSCSFLSWVMVNRAPQTIFLYLLGFFLSLFMINRAPGDNNFYQTLHQKWDLWQKSHVLLRCVTYRHILRFVCIWRLIFGREVLMWTLWTYLKQI